jgi:hypothetical protein
MQHIYRDLVADPAARSEPLRGQIEEAGEGLDLFNFRRIFFGTPDSHHGGKGSNPGDVPLVFSPFELAKLFLSRIVTMHSNVNMRVAKKLHVMDRGYRRICSLV